MVDAARNFGGHSFCIVVMGKSQKSARDNSLSFHPDYGIGTIGGLGGVGVHHRAGNSDSGEVGSSGQIDVELMASEDSCPPMRKCMKLNADNPDAFGVPLQVFSVANMPRIERRELEKKLRMDLEQVRGLQRKMASRCFNGVALSSSTAAISRKSAVEKAKIGTFVSANGKAKPNKKNGYADLPELPSGKAKNKVSKNGGRLNRGPSGRFESAGADEGKAKYTNHSVTKRCENLLDRLMAHQYAWVFNTPVDVVKLNIPDYLRIIKNPMDLGTIKSRLASGAYANPHAFAEDVRLTFSNAKTYNPPGNDVHIMADILSQFFEARWKIVEKKISAKLAEVNTRKTTMRMAAAEPFDLDQNPHIEIDRSSQKKRKISDVNDKANAESAKRVMTDAEKQKLSMDLENLAGDMLEHIIDFLRKHSESANQDNKDEIEIDIDTLNDNVLFTMRTLLDDHLKEKQAHQEKTDPIDVDPVEIFNESGISNSPMQPCKGSEPADEDVDIGVNDPPICSYPPVEIEKDMVPRGSKCSSSSSSSSDSESSSSESGSASSSGSESEGNKAVSPAAETEAAQETICSGPSLDHIGSEKRQTDDESCPVSELADLEHNSQSKAVSSGGDSHDQGENFPPERQVSPTKLYRAPLLRSRFADTILKAREKTLDQGKKGDPEKLRREQGKLERQQREEKARIEADAKAAEDAHREAEAVAAVELKKKRELEREAACLMLQKMEKTVEIDENCQVFKDLEMFQSAPLAEHLPSSVDETSPDHCEDMAAGFQLCGSNPLEQLGLYRKDEDEDDDDGILDISAIAATIPTAGDVEGEID